MQKKSEDFKKHIPRRLFTGKLNRITHMKKKKYKNTLKFNAKDSSFMSNKNDLEF
jgi:hypothetical protein